MSRRNFSTLLVAIVVALVCYARVERNPYARYVADGFRLIDSLALEQPPDDRLFAGAMDGMVGALREMGDEHSGFLVPEQAEPLREDLRQSFAGVGIVIRQIGEPLKTYVIGLAPVETGAVASGLRIGDEIVSADGVDLVGAPIELISSALRGEAGTAVKIGVNRLGVEGPIEIEAPRRMVAISSVVGLDRDSMGKWNFFADADRKIGYVWVRSFGDRTAQELVGALSELSAEGMKSLVLDLRQNPGGTIDSAVLTASQFLPAGAPIVETRGRDAQIIDRYAASGDGRWKDLPLALLVDRDSASASEIVAAALQDNRRGPVVGERTFGKGSVQRTIDIAAGRSMLKLTWATFWRPSGVNIHRMRGQGPEAPWGVRPDSACVVELSDEEFEAYRRAVDGRDLLAPLQAAVAAGHAPAELAPPAVEFTDRALDLALRQLASDEASAAGPAHETSPAGHAGPAR